MPSLDAQSGLGVRCGYPISFSFFSRKPRFGSVRFRFRFSGSGSGGSVFNFFWFFPVRFNFFIFPVRFFFLDFFIIFFSKIIFLDFFEKNLIFRVGALSLPYFTRRNQKKNSKKNFFGQNFTRFQYFAYKWLFGPYRAWFWSFRSIENWILYKLH